MAHALERAPAGLFDRLPEDLFSPLASSNRHQYWRLLCHLYQRRFSFEAPPVPGEGFRRAELIGDVQDFLSAGGHWQDEEDETPATPLHMRAQNVLNRLINSGWLRQDRFGIDKRISMDRKVCAFLGMLVEFAEAGPVYISGKIRSIEACVLGARDAGHGDQLAEAAHQVRHLLDHVRNTGTSVRDVMERLTPDLTTREFVRQFFSEFVTRIFIGDYRELRTTEHPLARRGHILEMVEQINDTEALRERVSLWYREQRCGGDVEEARRQLRRDLDRLRDLARIDEYLARLDLEVSRANKRALAFLDYRMRVAKPLDALIERAVSAVLSAGEECRAPLPAAPLIAQGLLRLPKTRIEREPVGPLRRSIPTDEQIARARIMQRIQDARDLSPLKLSAHAQALCAQADSAPSARITPQSPFELFAYQRLLDLALASGTGSVRLQRQARLELPGFEVQWEEVGEGPREAQPLGSRAFVLRRRAPREGGG